MRLTLRPSSSATPLRTREPYIIHSAQPKGRDQIAVEALHDHPSVWEALGEGVLDPGASAVGDKEDEPPQIAYIFAHTVQYSSQTLVEWVLGRVRNASEIIVDLSYDDWASFERISDGLSTSGQWPLRMVRLDEGTGLGQAWIRAYAINAIGIPGRAVNTSFTYWKPWITSEWASFIIHLEDLSEQVRNDIRQISAIGENTLRDAVRSVEKKVNELAALAATESAALTSSDRYVKVALQGQVGESFAAIRHEESVRIAQDSALAQTIDTVAVNLGDAQAAIVDERTARIDGDQAEATARLSLESAHSTTRSMVVQESTTRANADTALAQQVSVVSTTVDGHTVTISEVTQSLNGDSGFWGVAVTDDGDAVGGVALVGIRNLDGTIATRFGIYGDAVVTGTISGAALETQNIISVSAQIGNLIVDNIHVKNQAITQTYGATGNNSVTLTLTSRGTGNWVVWGYYYGASGVYVPLGSTVGVLSLTVASTQIDAITLNYEASGTSGTAGFARLQTTLVAWLRPAPGTFDFTASVDVGGVIRIVATEVSK